MNTGHLKVKLAEKIISFLPMSRMHKTKAIFLRAAGITVGENVQIWSNVKFFGTWIKIGNGGCLGYNVKLISHKEGPITIGNNCILGADVIVTTGGHILGPPEKRAGRGYAKPITIGNGVRISTRSVLVEGVTIGDGGQVAAGAVVVRDVPPNTLVGGVPARIIKELPLVV